MMRRQKTSRYFLLHLLPREALDASRLQKLAVVLRGSRPEAERRLAQELAEHLASIGVYERLGEGLYRDPAQGRSYQLGITPVPGPAEGPGPSAPGPEDAADRRTAAGEDGLATEHLLEILAALRLQGRQPGLRAGVRRLLAMVERWYPGSEQILYHFEALEDAGEPLGLPELRELEPETLAPQHPYRRAMSLAGVSVLDAATRAGAWYPPRRGDAEGHWLLLSLHDRHENAGRRWGLFELLLPTRFSPVRAAAELEALGQALTQLRHNHRILSDVVYVDALTQVYTRNFLELQLPLEIERATRNNEPLAMLVADLDDFKKINDGYGHDVGDHVLREFGVLIRDTLRKVDMVFRFGGEEFVILLPRLDEDSALRAAERLREAVAEHSFFAAADGERLPITTSIGGAIYPRDALSEETLFKAADTACYRAKNSGKNRVCFTDTAETDASP